MIILRGSESQTLPNRTGKSPVSYAGEGSALATAGKQIESVSNQALQYSASLNDHQARIHAGNVLKTATSTFENEANDAFYEWDNDHVLKGDLPEKAVTAYQGKLEAIAKGISTQYKGDVEGNNYLQGSLSAALNDAASSALVKARQYANTSFIKIQKDTAHANIDQGKSFALQAEARGDIEGFNVQAQKDLADIESLRGKLFNPAETDKLKDEYKRDLTIKKAYQVVARDPAGFLTAHANGEYQRLDPKDAKGLVDAAEQSLARKVTIQDHQDRKQLEQVNEQRTVLKNSAISQALTDPAGALAAVNNPTIRTFMGPEYDNTVATIRAMATDRGIDDPNVYRTVKSEIEQHPSSSMYKTLDKAMQNGTLRTGTYGTLMSRLTERLDKGKDHTETERQKLIRQGITTRKSMMAVTGIMNFDSASNQAMGLFDLEASQTLNDNPKLPVDETLDKLFIKHRQLTMDSFTSAAEGVIERHGLKSEADALERYKQGIMSRLESDEAIWYFQQGSKQKPSTPTTASSSNVKKKGLF